MSWCVRMVACTCRQYATRSYWQSPVIRTIGCWWLTSTTEAGFGCGPGHDRMHIGNLDGCLQVLTRSKPMLIDFWPHERE